MITIGDAIFAIDTTAVYEHEGTIESIIWRENTTPIPAEQIYNKLTELESLEPMRLLRIERDSKLQQSDWRTNNDYPYDDADAWATYRTALRNLPAEITAGNVTAPTIENNSLIFHDWPEQP
tara:strand:+ start:1779 stop:2144 length:366 start_codon:yes stop_codon:yes gene_type:complete